MFKEGDRVQLTVSKGGFSLGAEGVVAAVFSDGAVAVHIDKDANGNAVDPVFPLPPFAATDFSAV